jgi:tRNA U34 5-methylaminomethyl-2-thiouridine-forming methyltransferase MnmC
MRKEIITSEDGSDTLSIPEMNETYHSIHGALTESRHVFIAMGIDKLPKSQKRINIFEVGFGTGLNAMTTLEWLQSNPEKKINYDSIEAYPVSIDIIEKLNYASLFDFSSSVDLYSKIHQANWDESLAVSDNFELLKVHEKLQNHSLSDNYYDCIYFDAFAPNKQEEMWDVKILEACYAALSTGGRFVTYCAKGQLKRDLKAIGFVVEMVAGPPGKREMTTAIKK